jgi:hypothetical protein
MGTAMPLTKSSAMSFADTLTLLPSLTSVQILFFAFFCESDDLWLRLRRAVVCDEVSDRS